MKTCTWIIIAVMALSVVLTGCARENNDIVVVSREDGSGTRGAFIELFGIEQKDANGNKVDHTTEEAIIVNSTSVVMTTVTGNEKAIGYISLGSLNDTVKALKIDGAEATVANIKNNSYKAYRPFNIATKGSISELAQDFIDYILSSDGQAVVEASGYIAAAENGPYNGARSAGKIVVAGSSSVTPVMEKLKEAYLVLNPDANIEIQLSDSSTGMNYAMDGTADIGMASRELKDSELKVLNPTVIAIDGIAVIVNKENAVDNLSGGQIMEIFTGEITSWDKLTE